MVEAARSVLLELVHLLGEYRSDIVVLGGWVPQPILPSHPMRLVGSIDVDLALNHRNLNEAGYATIQKLLLGRGYEQDPRQPFIFHRTGVINGRRIKVEVHFLAGEYEGTRSETSNTTGSRWTRPEGSRLDLAFDLFIETQISGELPEGGKDQARVQVSSIVAFLVMKAMVLHDRLKRLGHLLHAHELSRLSGCTCRPDSAAPWSTDLQFDDDEVPVLVRGQQV
jgi:hypothetical protein